MKRLFLFLLLLTALAGHAQLMPSYGDSFVYRTRGVAPINTRFGAISDSAAYSGAVATGMGFQVIRSQYRVGTNVYPFETMAKNYPALEVHVVINILPLDSTQNYPDSATIDNIVSNLGPVIDTHIAPYNIYYIAFQNEFLNKNYYRLDASSARRYAYFIKKASDLFKSKSARYFITDGGITGPPVDYFVYHYLDSTGQTAAAVNYLHQRFKPNQWAGVPNWANNGPYVDAIARYREYLSYVKNMPNVGGIDLHYPFPINDSTAIDTVCLVKAVEAFTALSGGKEVVFNEVGFFNQEGNIIKQVISTAAAIGTRYFILYNGPDTTNTGKDNYFTNKNGSVLRPNGAAAKAHLISLRSSTAATDLWWLYKNGKMRMPGYKNTDSTFFWTSDANGNVILKKVVVGTQGAITNEADPTVGSHIKAISTGNIANWNAAFGWGNHAGLYRPINYVPSWSEVTGKPSFANVATSGNYNDLINKPAISSNALTLLSKDSNYYLNYNNLHNLPAFNSNTYLPYTGAAGNVDIGTHSLYAAAVGINNNSPQGALDVIGANNKRLVLDDANNAFKASGSNGDDMLYFDFAKHHFSIYTNDNNSFHQENGKWYLMGGNVGIGTGDPQALLDIAGDVHIAGNLQLNGSILNLNTYLLKSDTAQLLNPYLRSNVATTTFVAKVNGKDLSTNDYSNSEKTKLAAIATGATANSTDAQLRDRSTHTGTQQAATISDFQTAVSANADVADNTAARHTHSNKALLDTYTQTEANLADAVTKKHSHANQTALDNVSGVNHGDQDLSTLKQSSDSVGNTGYRSVGSANKTRDSLAALINLKLDRGDSTIANRVTANTLSLIGKTDNPYLYGSIYNNNSWSDLSAFANNGTTVALSTNKIQFSGGAGTFTQTLDYNYVTDLEKWSMVEKVLVGSKTNNSYGLGIGVRSNSSYGLYSLAAAIDFTTSGTTGGKISIYANSSSVVTSSAALTISAGDYVVLKLERSYDLITATAYNFTTKSAPISVTYNYTLSYPAAIIMPNSGRFAVYNFGGTQTLDSLSISSNEIKAADILFVGDSKTVGYYAGAKSARFADILGNYFRVSVNAGGFDGTADVLNRITEITNLAPKNVVLNIGRNDVGQGMATATIYANYDTITAKLTRAGIHVYHLLPLYETSVSQTGLTAHITTTFAASDIIDSKVYDYSGTASNVLVADNVHLNSTANAKVAESILNSGKFSKYLPSASTSTSNAISGLIANYVAKAATSSTLTNSIIKDDGTSVGIGVSSPAYKLDVAGIINTSSYLIAPSGAYFSGTNAGVNSVFATNTLSFRTNGVDNRMYIASDGKVGINTTSNATYQMQVNGTMAATKFYVSGLNTAPTSATDTGTTGEIRITVGYIYVCTATNTWVRTALTTW